MSELSKSEIYDSDAPKKSFEARHLDERIKYPEIFDSETPCIVEMEAKAFANLPVVSRQDVDKINEEMRWLLGSWEIKDGEISIHVHSAIELPSSIKDKSSSHMEINTRGLYATFYLDHLGNNRKKINFVGNVHSHPSLNDHEPSEADMETAIFLTLNLSQDDFGPKVFGIASHDNEKTTTIFYRLVRMSETDLQLVDVDSFKVVE